ncbi:disintegrin and metalloproteinase domain-containing protein 20-like isoform X2 [Cricetulus griseus]|uniref:Disintegrin and metalloproteinase domain-containing protein 20-like isoform X2 n=2 Tax=Cricetulus griseus TaxID=10029 RepID=A0A9J7FZW4_CRIGR|nr:disintegrin and metalloproteinase domain-containing protein 20-like isoform X2 [Cricetulus griseus]
MGFLKIQSFKAVATAERFSLVSSIVLSLNWGMRLVGKSVTLRAPLLLAALWVLLLVPSQCFQGRPTWRYVSSEVVTPRKVTYHGKGFQAPGRLSYSLRFRGQRHIIHMRRKTLIWPRHLLLTTQDDQGALQMDFPFFPVDCYYVGFLEEIPQSTVTLDTCSGGLNGVVMFDDLAYEIKPLSDSHRFEHVISQVVADSGAVGPMNKGKHTEHNLDPVFSGTNSSEAPRISSRDYASHPAAIKGHFQAGFSVYVKADRNQSRTCHYLFSLASLMDTYFNSIHVRYYVILLTVYTAESNYLKDLRMPGGLASQYYKNNFYNTYKPDSSNLVNEFEPLDEFYPVYHSVCGPDALNCVGQNNRYYVYVSVVVTHRVGWTLGLNKDDEEYCVCQRRSTCVMFQNPQLTDVFSNCSIAHLNHIFNTHSNLTCLFYDFHTYYNRSATYSVCGNAVINEGEQCDCGSNKACYVNPCCENNCTYSRDSICDKELCCTNCTYSPPGTLCRSVQNVCDLPEYCSGTAVTCPNDFYLQDGTPCSEEGYCYAGNCTDRNVHCKEIFGAGARAGNPMCYEINKEKFRFGHCRRAKESLVFTLCSDQDKMCGRLQCTNVTYLPHLQDHVSFHQSVISGFSCFGLDEHRGTGATDVGHVRYGTQCSKSNFCDRGSCNGSLTGLNYDCTPAKCNFRGVCNNLRHCHCHLGWEPPHCVGAGFGGSLDGGHLLPNMRTIRQSKEPVVYLRLVFGRIYLFIASLLFGVAFRVGFTKIIKYEVWKASALLHPQHHRPKH